MATEFPILYKSSLRFGDEWPQGAIAPSPPKPLLTKLLGNFTEIIPPKMGYILHSPLPTPHPPPPHLPP
ncbi:hypothetical protein VB712_09885, partial [Spirulina sp. CCNP1310]